METLAPAGWAQPKGYANGIAAEGRQVYVAGQIGWDPLTGELESDEFAAQAGRALANLCAIVAEAGGGPEHIARLTWFVCDREAYLADPKALGTAYRAVMGRHFPAMSVIFVSGLVDPGAKVEIEATAVIPAD